MVVGVVGAGQQAVEALCCLVPVLPPSRGCQGRVRDASDLFNYAATRSDQLTRQYGGNEGVLHFYLCEDSGFPAC